ncbi:UpxY family transcription antiterminator [Polaribacter tangerinus]|uniref:UpxY family transcription antiterminator n=1 Tax=Polaribacter tangerinus TaxID=1920034 RepID=UPI000B4B079F|nr:UpxY family transcription antiterminator [Polaribacter tangerinus]
MENKDKYWFVVFTKPKQELKVLERLDALGIVAYTPVKTEVRQWSDRKKKVKVPLLPSMVLVYLSERDTATVFNVAGVVRYLFDNGVRAKVTELEVVALKKYVAATYSGKVEKLHIGASIKTPAFNEDAIIISVKGNKCFAKLKKIGATISFKL